ncbi:hypothetical protein M8I34_21020 [Streptomyces sp. MCA2]|uniref:MmyB family transcriptional regulator n=1 Tax=Streptomyces sp. MCA2 TaxID=2944805 RepID=UPI00202201D7|nr:hypothetical protein [Streptomyces sp. MCA2]
MLNALARTLRLDHDERHHLYRLAGAADDAVVAECNAVNDELHAVLDKLAPYPACVRNGKFDLLAYNSAMCLLITDLDEVHVLRAGGAAARALPEPFQVVCRLQELPGAPSPVLPVPSLGHLEPGAVARRAVFRRVCSTSGAGRGGCAA